MSVSSAEPARLRSLRVGSPPSWCLGALLLLCASDASAAVLSRLVTSVGALAALAALLVMKSWPAHLPPSAVSAAGGALAVAGALAWWRVRATAEAAPVAQVTRPFGPLSPAAPVQLPPGIDADSLRALLRRQFVELQSAWDRGDMATLGALATPEMLDELRLERPACAVSDPFVGSTEVVTVDATLLGYETLGPDCVLSVEFSGLIRESPSGGAVPFRELWMLTRSNRQAEGWRLARHQALL
jgi:predicted lipid-binding transport protein (Tim44 family)